MTVNLRPHGIVSRRLSTGLPPNMTIQADSHLTEDLVLSANVLVDPPAFPGAGTLAPFFNPAIGQSEALVIQSGELFYVCREPLTNSGWNYFGIGAGFPFIAPLDSAGGWAFADDGTIWQSNAASWFSPATGPVPTAAGTGTDGSIFGVVNDTLQILDTQTAQWMDPPVGLNVQIPNETLPAGSATNFWFAVQGDIATVNNYTMNGYEEYILNYLNPDIPLTLWMQQVFVGFDGTVVAIDNTGGGIWWFNANSEWYTKPWELRDENNLGFTDLAVISAGQMWALQNNGLWYYTFNQKCQGTGQQITGPFQLQSGPYNPTVSLGTDQTLWLSDSYGTVWKYLPTSAVPWQRQIMPPGVSGVTQGWNVADVVALPDSNGTVHAFFTCAGGRNGLYCTSLVHGLWQPPTGVSISGASDQTTYNKLAVQLDAVAGDVVVYATSSTGQLMLARASGGALYGQSVSVDALQPLQLIIDGASWYFVGLINQVPFQTQGTSTNPVAVSDWTNCFTVSPQYQAILPDSAAQVVFLVDAHNTLWEWTIGSNILEPLTGPGTSYTGAFTAVSIVNSTLTGMRYAFGIDSNDQLWLMRQAQTGTLPSWTMWHPMGDACSALPGGAGAARVPEFWFVDTGLSSDGYPSLNLLSQNPVNSNWTVQPVVKPAQADNTPEPTASYVTQITLINQAVAPAPVPVPGVPVTISVLEPVIVSVEGQTCEITPGQPQTFTTDEMGRVTLVTAALGLHTAALNITAPNAPPLQVYPPTLAHQTLQATTDLTTAQATATTATPNPVQTPLVPSSQTTNAANTLTAIQGVFSIQQQNNIQPDTVGPNQSFTVLSSSGTGGFWDDIVHFAEDIWHAIRNFVMTIADVAVDIEKGIVQLSVALADRATAVLAYVVHTIDDVARAIESAFAWVAAEVGSVINWLKELFEWGDILNTAQVLANYVNTMLQAGSAYFAPDGPLQTLIGNQLNALKTTIDTNLNNLLSNNGSLQDLAQGNALQPQSDVQTAHGNNQARSNYAHRQTQNYVQNGGKLAAVAATTTSLSNFTNQINTTSGNSSQATTTFQNAFQNMASNPSSFFTAVVADLVKAIQSLVDALIVATDVLVDFLLDMLSDTLEAFQTALNAQINIPILSWLFKEVTGEPLTLLNVGALIFALPTTIIYKIINGQPPYDPATVSGYINAKFNFPPVGTGLEAGMLGMGPPLDNFGGFAMLVTMIGYGILDCAGDVISVTGTDAGPGGYVVGFISILFSLGALFWTAPWAQFSEDASNWSGADVLYVASWIVAAFVAALNIPFFIWGFGQAKLAGLAGQIATGFAGIIALGFGFAFCFAVAGDDDFKPTPALYQAAAIIGAAPSAQKLIYPLLDDDVDAVLVFLFGAVDILCDWAYGALSMAEDLISSGEPQPA